MRRLALLALAAATHLAATVLAIGVSFALAVRDLASSAAGPLAVEPAIEMAAWVLGFPVLAAAFFAEVYLLDGSIFYWLAALNSATWAAAAVLLRRAWSRRRSGPPVAAGGTA